MTNETIDQVWKLIEESYKEVIDLYDEPKYKIGVLALQNSVNNKLLKKMVENRHYEHRAYIEEWKDE